MRVWAFALPRLGPWSSCGYKFSSTTANNTCCGFRKKLRTSPRIPVRLEFQKDILSYSEAAGIGADAKDRAIFRAMEPTTKQLAAICLVRTAICQRGKRWLERASDRHCLNKGLERYVRRSKTQANGAGKARQREEITADGQH